jgi:MFS family permease
VFRRGDPRLILFLTIFVAILGLSVLFPVLAPLSVALGLRPDQVGWFSTIYSLMQVLTAPIWGRRSERVGRKPVLITGLLGYGISFAAFGVFAHLGLHHLLSGLPLFALLLLARGIGGSLSSATLPTAQAYMADLSDAGGRSAAMGMIGAAFGLGIVFGPALGGLLSELGLLAPIYFSAGLALLVALFAWKKLKESRPQGAATRADYRPALRFAVWTFLITAALYTLASVGMEQTIGFYIQDQLGLRGTAAVQNIAVILSIFGFSGAAIQGGAIRPLSRRFGQIKLIWAGLLIMAAGMFAVPATHSFLAITSALILIAVGSSLIAPNLTAAISLQVGPDLQGTVAGMSSSALGLGRMLGPVIGTTLFQTVSQGSPYLFSGGLLLALLLFSLLSAPALTLRASHN